MRKLPTTFKKYGDLFLMEMRTPNAAMYSRTDTHGCVTYEVIKIRKVKKTGHIAGRAIAAGEYFPRSENWGSAGWTFVNFNDAHQKLHDISEDGETIECIPHRHPSHTIASKPR